MFGFSRCIFAFLEKISIFFTKPTGPLYTWFESYREGYMDDLKYTCLVSRDAFLRFLKKISIFFTKPTGPLWAWI
jgi:hypothetical protein